MPVVARGSTVDNMSCYTGLRWAWNLHGNLNACVTIIWQLMIHTYVRTYVHNCKHANVVFDDEDELQT